MPIEWEHARFLWGLAALPALWVFTLRSWAMPRPSGRVLSAVFRSTVLALFLLALAEPVQRRVERRELPASIAVVRDRSLSVLPATPEADEGEQRYLSHLQILGAPIRVEFARTGQLTGQSPSPEPESTNIELGLERARAEIPAASAAAIILLTDGRATAGDAIRAAARLRAQGAMVYAVPIGRAVRRGPRILGVEPPPCARMGQPARVLVRVRSDQEEPFELRLLDGKGMEVDRCTAPGRSEFTLVMRYLPREVGFQNCRVLVRGSDETPGEQTIASAPVYVEGPPKVLVLDTLPDEAQYLLAGLKDTHLSFEVRAASAIPDYPDLIKYDAVILNDCAQLADATQLELVRYVREAGGGLLFIGGSNVRTQALHGGELEKILPVEFLPEEIKVLEQPRPVHVCFVLDKSGSMDAPLGSAVSKIDMLKAAVQRSVAELPSNGIVSVVVFDAMTRVLVPPTPVANWPAVSRQIDELLADGGTVMDTAVETGIRLLEQGENRYMILLTDGLTNVSTGSPEQRWAQLIARMRHSRIALTTIALGQEADRDLLNNLAWKTRGTSYDCLSADEVPKVFIKEAQTIKQQAREARPPFRPDAGPAVRMLRGIPFEALPALARALPAKDRDLAEVVLTSDKREPLLAMCQEGLGSVAVFTSDAKPLWARQWLGWNAFGRFWSQVLGWVLRSPNRVQAEVKPIVEGAEVRVLVRAVDEESRPLRGLEPSGWLFSAVNPNQPPNQLTWREAQSGVYEGTGVLSAPGNHLCRVQLRNAQTTVFSHSTLLGASNWAELAETGPDLPALQAIATAGGGTVNPTPQQVADQLQVNRVRQLSLARQLWPMLVFPAVLLWLVDVAVRRIAGGVNAPGYTDKACRQSGRQASR